LAAIAIVGTNENVFDFPDMVGVVNNTIEVTHNQGFAVRAQGAITISVIGNLISGAGIYIRATIMKTPFRSAVVNNNTIRNFGKHAIHITGNKVNEDRAMLFSVDVSHNLLDDLTQTMTTGIQFDTTLLNEDIQVTLIGNQCIGAHSNALTNYPSAPVLVGGTRGAGGIYSVKGSPDGIITETIGAMALRRDGNPEPILYVKESGTGNHGWVGKPVG
jgi:hypothetical protein